MKCHNYKIQKFVDLRSTKNKLYIQKISKICQSIRRQRCRFFSNNKKTSRLFNKNFRVF